MLESGLMRGPDMKRSKFTEEQIIAILREQEAGAKTAEVCRRHGISSATFYAWKAKFEPHRVCRRLILVSYAAMGSVSRAA